ncbi:protein MRG1-like isoform X3 [Oryza glaberrima]|uniref:protein MRG1-like isoform X3 n=1 Tax=Oryza glaberrima TaxID=4538 RepID=UPI00224C2ABA|nr:protein MRG1-like isoform X3 [Oryza glaberrima]
MGGSSNTNTNTSSGGGKDKHDETSPSFKEGERVLAYHGPLLYEAKVQKSENKEDEWRYHVHYLGWSKSWDEWVTNDRLLKLTDENIRKQQELEKSQAVDKSVKSGRSAQHKPKGSNADAKTDKEDTKIIVKGKKRKSQPGGTEEKERKSSESLFMSHFPSTLKKQLVDDWEFVTQLGKLVKLPRSPTVDDILKKYLEHRTKKDNKTLASSEGATTTINDSYAEILKGLRCYFDKALPAMLLYKKERQQYTEEVKGDVSPSIIYGAEHLLRLFVKLPELLASVNMEEDALNKLQQKLLDILKFLQKNQSSFFLSAYDGGSKGTDGIKTK